MNTLLKDTLLLIRAVCEELQISADYCTLLTTPKQTVQVHIPLKRKDGSLEVFTGFRVLHSNSLGPGKGGLMIAPDITKEECQAFALRMTLKCALVNLPLGGAAGLIQANTKNLTFAEIEHVVRRFTSAILNLIGPEKDVMGPDLNTDPRLMGTIMDTYSMDVGQTVHQVVTGKPLELGGIIGREQAMGLGLGYLLHELARTEFEEIQGQNIVIQGLGNVGQNCAQQVYDLGAKVIAVSDSTTGLYNPEGLDIPNVILHKRTQGSLLTYDSAEKISNDALLSLPCDTLIPCAVHNQITQENVQNIQCRRVIEGANGALSLDAIRTFWDRNIPVLPDILANAGGVIVSYLEWVQNFQELTWTLDEVKSELKRLIVPVFHKVHDYKIEHNVSYRTAAYHLAILKLYKSSKIRGIFP